jgi:hypothetical protein
MIYTRDNIEGVQFTTVENDLHTIYTLNTIYTITNVTDTVCTIVWPGSYHPESVSYETKRVCRYLNNTDKEIWVETDDSKVHRKIKEFLDD